MENTYKFENSGKAVHSLFFLPSHVSPSNPIPDLLITSFLPLSRERSATRFIPGSSLGKM
jgi:hypothetical protein